MAELGEWLFDPYQFEFMRRALASLLIVSVVGSLVGTFVVHKGLAASGSGLAHATLAGVAIAFVNGVSVALGALIAAVAAALGVGFVRRHARVSYDTAIAIFFVSAFSLGILVMSRQSGYTPDLLSFVFGDILGVSQADLLGELVLGAVVVLFVLAFYRELVMVAYDPAMASAAGVPAAFFEYALLALIAAAVVVALQAIGIVLVSAILIIPPATAGLLAHRLPRIILLAIAFSAVASVVGLHLSFHGSVATGPAVVLVSATLFALVLAGTALRRPRLPALEAGSAAPAGTPLDVEARAKVRQSPS